MKAGFGISVLAVFATLALHAICLGAPAELDVELAREPAVVVTTAGRTVRGILDGCRDGRLHIRLATDGGEVGYAFTSGEIAHLTLPGREMQSDVMDLVDRGELEAALPRLEALARHRLRYLAVLTPEDRHVLWLLAKYAAQADPGTVAAVLRALEVAAVSGDERFLVQEARLEHALRTCEPDQIRALAEHWCAQADTSASSALGWRVLARLAYDAGHYDEARWIALQPVTFFGDAIVRDLDSCYAIAVAAADRMGDTAHAQTLVAEMTHRLIPWPADPAWAGLAEHYANATGLPANRPFFPPRLESPHAAATLQSPSLDTVRKLSIPTS